jgi:hypothetical protein
MRATCCAAMTQLVQNGDTDPVERPDESRPFAQAVLRGRATIRPRVVAAGSFLS